MTQLDFSLLVDLREDQAYLLGRAWAVADAICSLAETGAPYTPGGSNAIQDTMGPFLASPARHYPRITKLAQDRLAAARGRDPELAGQLDELLTGIGAQVGDPLPKSLTDEQSAAAVAGLSHQRTRIVAHRLDATQRARDEAMEQAKAWAREMHAAGESETAIATRLRINRQTVRAALGK